MKSFLSALFLATLIQFPLLAGGVLCSVEGDIKNISVSYQENNLVQTKAIGKKLATDGKYFLDNNLLVSELGEERAAYARPILENIVKLADQISQVTDPNIALLVAGLETQGEFLRRVYLDDKRS